MVLIAGVFGNDTQTIEEIRLKPVEFDGFGASNPIEFDGISVDRRGQWQRE